jgi:hypothetical protein
MHTALEDRVFLRDRYSFDFTLGVECLFHLRVPQRTTKTFSAIQDRRRLFKLSILDNRCGVCGWRFAAELLWSRCMVTFWCDLDWGAVQKFTAPLTTGDQAGSSPVLL